MPSLIPISAALSSLSVNTTSKHPTVSDSLQLETELFDERDTTSPTGPTLTLTPFITNVTVKHSSAFNSQRASGMSKLQQIQFVDALKKMIIDEAALTYPASKDLVVSISRSDKAGHAFCSAAVHTATLLARHIGSQTWIVLGRGDECEYLADAVESLWEKSLVAARKVVEGCQVGKKISEKSSVDRDSSIGAAVASER